MLASMSVSLTRDSTTIAGGVGFEVRLALELRLRVAGRLTEEFGLFAEPGSMVQGFFSMHGWIGSFC